MTWLKDDQSPIAKYNGKPSKYWNDFYENNANNFFKDRKWLHLEFPDLVKAAEPDVGIGAGVYIPNTQILNRFNTIESGWRDDRSWSGLRSRQRRVPTPCGQQKPALASYRMRLRAQSSKSSSSASSLSFPFDVSSNQHASLYLGKSFIHRTSRGENHSVGLGLGVPG